MIEVTFLEDFAGKKKDDTVLIDSMVASGLIKRGKVKLTKAVEPKKKNTKSKAKAKDKTE